MTTVDNGGKLYAFIGRHHLSQRIYEMHQSMWMSGHLNGQSKLHTLLRAAPSYKIDLEKTSHLLALLPLSLPSFSSYLSKMTWPYQSLHSSAPTLDDWADKTPVRKELKVQSMIFVLGDVQKWSSLKCKSMLSYFEVMVQHLFFTLLLSLATWYTL